MRTTAWLSAIALLGIVSPIQAGLITIDSTFVASYAHDENVLPFDDFNFDESTAIPTNTVVSASVGASSASATIKYHDVGSQTILDFGLTHSRAGGSNAYAASAASWINFTALQDTVYDLSGSYVLSGDGSTTLYGRLVDVTANVALFDNYQFSISTSNESLTLGQANGGDNMNSWLGSPTGALFSGHQYQLIFDTSIWSFDGRYEGFSPDSATALGNIKLKIGDAITAAPEPASMTLLALTAIGSIGLQLRRKRKAQVTQVSA